MERKGVRICAGGQLLVHCVEKCLMDNAASPSEYDEVYLSDTLKEKLGRSSFPSTGLPSATKGERLRISHLRSSMADTRRTAQHQHSDCSVRYKAGFLAPGDRTVDLFHSWYILIKV
jgi:hypothetical protein